MENQRKSRENMPIKGCQKAQMLPFFPDRSYRLKSGYVRANHAVSEI